LFFLKFNTHQMSILLVSRQANKLKVPQGYTFLRWKVTEIRVDV
jgi:hypothetical protein